MCGFVGYAAERIDPETLERMSGALRHRGPDGDGLWWCPERRVALAHRRLAIVDLSAAGHQPMSDGSGRVWIVFNGEIYNHRELRSELTARGHVFRSRCDTEVLVEAYRTWGEECLSRLNGMFAFALYDQDRRRIFLARDRAGEKPLYYGRLDGRFVFASELKALMADPTLPRRLDPSALASYLAWGYVPGEQSMLRDVRKLAPAHAASYGVDGGDLRVWRYWTLPELDPQAAAADDEELEEEAEALLTDAVRRQLVADVPVGILLSGGLDSSLVTAVAVRVSSAPVRTFTVTFPGHGAYDEAAHARRVARHFGTEHTELVAEADCLEELPELARCYDEPFADSSLVPTFLLSRQIREHATVALGGDGGDELFGGYTPYREMQRPARGPRALRRAAAAVAGRLPLGLRGRNALLAGGFDGVERLSYPHVFFDARSRRRLLRPARDAGLAIDDDVEAERAALYARRGSLLSQATATDFSVYLPDDILVKVDRASMAVSLEIRAPWLDYRLCELAFGRVPDRLKATAQATKILPKRLARRLLPEDHQIERKQGFSIPLAKWLRGPWGGFVEETLREAEPRLFNRRMLDELLRTQKLGFSQAPRLFALTMFELWRRHYEVEIG